MVIIACNCTEGMGLAHSHIPEMIECINVRTQTTITIPVETYRMNAPVLQIIRVHQPTIRAWINWRDFAESVLRDPVGSAQDAEG